MAKVRPALVGFCLTVTLSGCGGDAMSLSEYATELNGIGDRATQQAEVVFAEAEQITTPNDVAALMDRVRTLRIETLESYDALDPPEEVADLHQLILDWMAGMIPIEEALAVRAGTVADWEELSQSLEMAAYRAGLSEGKQMCTDLQAELDATAARGVFVDTPWVPSDLKVVVEAVLGCDTFPENPEDVYRQPPAATP